MWDTVFEVNKGVYMKTHKKLYINNGALVISAFHSDSAQYPVHEFQAMTHGGWCSSFNGIIQFNDREEILRWLESISEEVIYED